MLIHLDQDVVLVLEALNDIQHGACRAGLPKNRRHDERIVDAQALRKQNPRFGFDMVADTAGGVQIPHSPRQRKSDHFVRQMALSDAKLVSGECNAGEPRAA